MSIMAEQTFTQVLRQVIRCEVLSDPTNLVILTPMRVTIGQPGHSITSESIPIAGCKITGFTYSLMEGPA